MPSVGLDETGRPRGKTIAPVVIVSILSLGIVGPFCQVPLASCYRQKIDRGIFNPLRAGMVSEQDFDRIERAYRWLGRIGSEDLFQERGEVFFSLSQRALVSLSDELRLGASQRAREYFSLCLRNNPFNEVCRTKLAWIYWKMNNFQKAEELQKAVVGINQSDPDGFYNLGTFYYYTGRFREAREYFQRLTALAPGYHPQAVKERLTVIERFLP